VDIEKYIATGNLEAYVLDHLSSKERIEVESLLAQYPELKVELDLIESNLEALATSTAIQPPSDLKSIVLDQIEEPKNKAGSLKREIPVIPIKPETSRTWNYVAAASITLALVSSYMAYDYHNKWKTTEDAYGQLQAANQQMAEQYNQVNRRLDDLVVDIDVISNSDFAKINMAAVNEEEEFSASIYWNAKTQDAYLNIQDLKILSEDQQYQLWAIVDGKPVDMGVFDFDQQGLLKMKPVANALMFAVTIEPKGGSKNPTMEAMQVAGAV